MSQFLVDYRAKHPEYDDLNDSDLSTALHGQYVNDTGADLSLDQFHSAIEFAPVELPQEPVIPTSDMDAGLPQDPTEPTLPGPQVSILDMVGAKLTDIGRPVVSGIKGAIPQAKLQVAGLLQRNEAMDEETFNSSFNLEASPFKNYEQYKSVTESLNPITTWLGKKGKEMAAAARAEIEPSTAEQGSPEYYAEAITGSVINMIPALGVSILGRRPDIGLGIMLAQAKGGSFEAGRSEGLQTDEAEIYSTLNMIAEVVPSAIPIAKFMKPTGKFVRDMVEAGLTESAQETVTAALQAGIDKGYIQSDMTWGEAASRMIDGAVVGLGAGATISAATGRVAKSLEAKERESAVIAEMEAEFDRNMPSAEQEAVDSLSPDNAQVTVEMRPRIPIPERLPGRTEKPEEEADVAQDTGGVPQQRVDEGGIPADQPDIEQPGMPGQDVGDIAAEPARGGEPAEPIRIEPSQPAPAVEVSEESVPTGTSDIRSKVISGNWTLFAEDSGTLNIPRSEMPQVKAEHRGALANFLNARDIIGNEEEVPASTLKPTQAEFSEEKVQKAKDFEGGNRAILASSDGHILDGHHQWLAARDNGEDIRIIRLDAPISTLLEEIKEFPSNETSDLMKTDDAPAKPVQEKPASVETPKAEQGTDYATNPVETYTVFRKSISSQTATVESIKKDADSLVANKESITAALSDRKFTKPMLQEITRSPRTDIKKSKMVEMAYEAMLSDHVLGDSVITVFGGSQTYEEQIIEQVAKQTQEDVDNAYDKQREYRAQRKADIEGDVKSLKKPETLSDFGPLTRSKGKEIVEQMIDYADIQPGDEVLELSEFGGSIGGVLKESVPDANLELIDVMATKEFMEYSGKKYDKIIMNPPLGDFQDIDHVKHAYELLKPGGKIVAIMGARVKSSRKKAVEFRQWIDDMGSYIEDLPAGRPGVMVTLEKNDSNTLNYKLDEGKKPRKGEPEIFRAPGHNYVGLYRATGIPARREFVSIDGKRIRVPAMPQRIEPIMRKLIKIAGRRIYFGKIKGRSTQGFYRNDVGEIRTRRKNDVEVLAHELAHYLDMYSNVSLPNFKKLYKNKKYSDEVKALSYTDADNKVMQIEGFAEFVRLWLTNSAEAQQRSPGFYDAFNTLLARDKKLSRLMTDMRELMHKFYFQGPDKLGQALIGKSSSFLADFEQWKYRRDSRIRQQMIDRFHAARVIEQELTDKIGVVEESAWKQLRIANGGAEGISDYIMNYGTVEFDESGDLVKNGKSLHDVLEPVKSIDRKPQHEGDSKIDILMRYFAGRRAVELHRQGRENLIPRETAFEWAKLGKDYPVFESIHKEFQAFNDRMMEFYVQSGMITPKARNAMRSMNKDYVPFNRIREALASGGGASSGFQKLKGGTANLNDILVNIQDGITANVRAALNNKAKQRLYGYIAGHKDGAIFATKIAPDSRPVQVYVDEMMNKINRVLDASGIEFEGEIDLTDPDLLTFWQHGVKPQLNESGNIVDTVIIDGKKKYYEVQDPLLQDMLLSMNPESYSSFMNVMFGVKNFFTRMITLGVEFTGANLVRDTVGATFLSKSNFVPFVDSFKGMYSFIAKDQHFQDFLRSGGGYSSRIHAQTKEGTARRRVAVDEFGIMSVPERLLSTIDNIASAFEYGTRIGEFRVEKRSNRSDMDAGFASREISTDFSVLGANRFITGYIRTVPFLNAMVQSQDRVYREAFIKKKYDGNPTRLAMKAFMGITVPTLILYLMNRDDDDYKEIPDYEKRTNWHIKVGDDRFIKIPRPYDVGFVFATMPELFFKYLEDEKGKEFADGMIWTLTQMYGIDGTPAMMTGWWDIVRNEKWTGAPVVPKGLADVEATEQYSSNTSETFIRLGKAMGVSPVKAEHMFKAYTGYLGGYLMWGTDNILWDEEKFGPKPDRKASDNIFLRRFLTTDVRPGTSTMEKFFDLKEKSDKIVATFKQTVDVRRAIKKKTGDGKFKDDKFFGLSGEEKAVLFGLNDSMNKLIKALYGKEGIKTAELQVRYDKKLTGAQKRGKLDDLWRSRNKAFMSYYTAADKAMQKAKIKSEQMKKEK